METTEACLCVVIRMVSFTSQAKIDIKKMSVVIEGYDFSCSLFLVHIYRSSKQRKHKLSS